MSLLALVQRGRSNLTARNCRAPSLQAPQLGMTDAVDEQGYFVLAKHVVVEFAMKKIVGLSLRKKA